MKDSNIEDSNIEEKLDQVLDRVIDWLKYEEAKNAALVTLDGVGLGVILQWLGSQSGQKLSVLLRTSQAALLLSLIVALFSFYPVLHGRWLQGLASRRRKRYLHEHPEWTPSILFFGDIAGITREDYLKDFHKAFHAYHNSALGENRALELDYAQQIVTNSEITLLKAWVFKRAFVIALLGFLATCLAAFVHLIGWV
jgi:hypothetical protein